MKKRKKYMYLGLPLLGVLFYLAYIERSAIDMIYTDYIRLINSYLPDVWNPEKFFVPDVLTRIPVNYLERGINVCLFGYSVTFDRIMSIMSFGAAALLFGNYCRKKELGMGWYLALMVFMFSLNKWEMLYNGTGWAHFLAFTFFYYTYLVLDRVYGNKGKKGDLIRLLFLPAITTIGIAGPYCAIYSMTLLLAYGFVLVKNKVPAWKTDTGRQLDGPKTAVLILFVLWPLAAYLWSNSQAVYEHSGAVDTPLMTAFFQEPKFFLKFFLKSFASMIFGVEWIARNMAEVPGKVWCLLGAFVMASYFLALWMNFYYGIVEDTIFPLMLLAGGGMNHLLVLASRYIFMPNDGYGMSSRYALQYQIGILGILLTFALTAKKGYRPEKGKGMLQAAPKGMRTAAILISFIFLAGNIITTAEEFSFGVHRKNRNQELKAVVLNFENETDEALIEALEYRKPGIREALTILKENGFNIFREK